MDSIKTISINNFSMFSILWPKNVICRPNFHSIRFSIILTGRLKSKVGISGVVGEDNMGFCCAVPLTKAEDLAMESGGFSRWPRTSSARQRHSNATGTG